MWRRRDEDWLERCTLIHSVGRSALWTMEGTVVGTTEDEPFEVGYQIHCDEGWATAVVIAEARIGIELRNVELIRSDAGPWLLESEGSEVPGLDGAVDVDLGFTPATNTLPIRRLNLGIGDSAEILVAWVRFPQLTVEPFPQRYTRLADRHYLYESLTSDFRAELEVDELGLVVNYQGLFERQSESSAPSHPSEPTR